MLIVNTCAFIDKAKQESIDTILELARAQEDGPLLAARRHRAAWPSAIATSCAQQIPEIDVVLGTGEVPEIVERSPAAGPMPRATGDGAPLRLYQADR